ECEDNEKPLHKVTLSPFYIDEDETTWQTFVPFLNTLRDGYVREKNYVYDAKTGQWAGLVWDNQNILIVGLNDKGDYELGAVSGPGNWAVWLTPGASVGGVSQLGAALYCASLGKRLPTEAEWEHAARGNTLNIYPCSASERTCGMADWGLCAGEKSECGDLYSGACAPLYPLGGFECLSPYGAKRMVGNADEWVQDQLWGGYSWCKDGCVDPHSPKIGPPILKGGDIGMPGIGIRISYRLTLNGPTSSTAGIRCARDGIERDTDSDGGVDAGGKNAP
ncbi:MAG: SUMF1/EgtB/PvdO family nonheme iron enzyme, partial [Deltaproteobacteria bacterium]|nr:SUMF1/EgtB/PvdO family nonheme iron enzyme [Deltaproteobacteria bacterium]